MAGQAKSKFWLDIVVSEIIKSRPSGEIIVESGISPSGAYHIGSFREVVTADVLTRGLQKRGRRARHIHFVDDSDPLRKLYPFLPKEFEHYIGWPYWLIPDPAGDCHKTYADHYFSEFKAKMDEIGAEMEVLISHEQYMNGWFDQQLDQAIEKADQTRTILDEVSNRDLPADWTGIQVLSDDKNFTNVKAEQWSEVKKLVAEGKVKLAWRLDWPARWARIGVDVEPFGREHATKGGSYETGARLVKEVFGKQPPFAVPYDTINLPGDSKKMSSSIGNLVSLADGLEIMPPEVLRYFIIRSRPERKLYFDSGKGLYNLIDEFAAAEANTKPGFREAYEVSVNRSRTSQRTIASIPFSHMVQVYQAALGDMAKAIETLERTGYEDVVTKQAKTIENEFAYVKNWLGKYAPDEVKFTVQPKLPAVDLTASQKQFLNGLADAIVQQKGQLDGQWLHDTIYKLSEQAKLKSTEAFQSVYQVILGQDHGPKAGWFLASLDKNWLVKRLKLEA